MTPIKIDLRNLTQAHVDEALNHLGECLYSAPCIIGTLIPVKDRDRLDYAPDYGGGGILHLARDGHVEFPDDAQRDDAYEIQKAFDIGSRDTFLRKVKPWL